MTAAETIADFATSLTLDDVPEEVVEHAKLHVLDALGCGLAAHATGNGVEGRATMRELGGEAAGDRDRPRRRASRPPTPPSPTR